MDMTRLTRRIACSITLGLLVLAAPLATPETAFAQDDATLQMARERFQEGVKYYDAKQYDKARAAFLQAYALKKHPAVLLNLAQSELRSSHEADAAKHFSQYLRENREASAAERQEAEKGLAAAKASVGEITVNVETADADVYIDGNAEGRSPLAGPVFLKAGAHTLEARKDGKTASTSVTALAGQSGAVDLRFSGPSGVTPAPGLPPAAGGTEPGNLPPPGMDGQPSGPGPGPGPAGPGPEGDTGKPGFIDWAKSNKVAWVGAGITVVGLGAGIGFGLSAKNNYDNADSAKSQILKEKQNIGTQGGPCDSTQDPATKAHYADACSKYNDLVSKGDSAKTIATVSFVIGAAAAAGTVVYYFIDTGSHSAKVGKSRRAAPKGFEATVLPYLGAHEGGIGVLGQF
jgi:tetratricopeptide (TPR) repeat protein